MRRFALVIPFALVGFIVASPAAAVVNIDWMMVGDRGNAGDTEVMTCCGSSTGTTGYGSVSYTYRISKYEVTNAQYTEFLNAVATTDTNDLYNTDMGSTACNHAGFDCGGITRGGTSGSYTYSVITGRGDLPVNHVSFYDALRFANWLHNGQPTGAQDSTTTEDGAYDMSLGSSVARKPGAKVFLTSEDEWYKAAYYARPGTYYDYPAGSDTSTSCWQIGAKPNAANCDEIEFRLTDVGSYTASASPYGTFDQGGNVWEWNEALIGSDRGIRGGGFLGTPSYLRVSRRSDAPPTYESAHIGFRVASGVPAFGVPSLGPSGLLVLAASLLGFGAYRRGRAGVS